MESTLIAQYAPTSPVELTELEQQFVTSFMSSSLLSKAIVACHALELSIKSPEPLRSVLVQELVSDSVHIRDYVLIHILRMKDPQAAISTLTEIARSSTPRTAPSMYGMLSMALLCTDIYRLPAWVAAQRAGDDPLAHCVTITISLAMDTSTLKSHLISSAPTVMLNLSK